MCERKISTPYGVLTCDTDHALPYAQHHAFHPGGDVVCPVAGPHPEHGSRSDNAPVVGKHEPHVLHDQPEFEIYWYSELPPIASHTIGPKPAPSPSPPAHGEEVKHD